jgi:hypothetical protein
MVNTIASLIIPHHLVSLHEIKPSLRYNFIGYISVFRDNQAIDSARGEGLLQFLVIGGVAGEGIEDIAVKLWVVECKEIDFIQVKVVGDDDGVMHWRMV